MSQQISNFVKQELKNLKVEILKLISKSKIEDLEKLFLNSTLKISDVIEKKLYYTRDRFGRVESFSDIEEVSKMLNIKPTTLKCYLSGKGYETVKGYIVSKTPLEEMEINNPNLDPNQLWIRNNDGTVKVVKNIDEAAKILKLSARTLYTYLSAGKGIATTKHGLVSKSPLTELSFNDAFQLTFKLKHHRWPEDHELPIDRTGRY